MASDTVDYVEQWVQFLSNSSRYFSKTLFTPNTSLIVSPDLSKIAVIDDDENKSAFSYYGQEKEVYVDLRFVTWCGDGISAPFNCPACERFHAISFVDKWNQNDWGPTCIHRIYIHEERNSFECVCGVEFVIWDSREDIDIPFDLRELAPLYQVGMPRDTDLLLRFVLGLDSRSLVEDICVISRMPYEGSLTDDPLRKFYWTVPPSFVSESNGRYDSRRRHVHDGVRDVRVWRRRIYVLDCDRFTELTRQRYSDDYERVDRYIKGRYEWSALAFTPPDELLSNSAFLESIVIANRLPPGTWGGKRNVKVAGLSDRTRKALGKRYIELRDSLTKVKRDIKVAYEDNGEAWRRQIIRKYPVLKKHRDLLEALNVYSAPDDEEGFGGKEPWQVAIEIAAREVVPNYEKNSVGPDSLKKAALIH